MGVVLTKSGRGPKIFAHALRAVVILPQLKFNPSYALGYSVVIVSTLHKHMKEHSWNWRGQEDSMGIILYAKMVSYAGVQLCYSF